MATKEEKEDHEELLDAQVVGFKNEYHFNMNHWHKPEYNKNWLIIKKKR